MVQKQIYIITGGSGFGKTGLINELRQSGYLCSGEFARELIDRQHDSIRSESYEEAIRIHQSILETYSGLNYQIIELPLFSFTERVTFMLKTIKNLLYHEH